MAKQNRIRLSLDVSQELNETLEKLAYESDTSKSELLRRAIALMELAVDAKGHGQKMGVFEKVAQEDRLVKEVVGF